MTPRNQRLLIRDRLRHAPQVLEAYNRMIEENDRQRRLERAVGASATILAVLIVAAPFICWAILYWD